MQQFEKIAPVVMSREEAAAAGKNTFYTGKPCKNGHIAPRYVTNAGCLMCAKRWKVAKARNPFSHDLIPWSPHKLLWRSKRLDGQALAGLDAYMQKALDTYCAHFVPPVCKACDGTHLVPVRGASPPRWEACEECAEPVPCTPLPQGELERSRFDVDEPDSTTATAGVVPVGTLE